MSNFCDEMKRTLNNEFNLNLTENGALGYCTTQSALLDMNFKVSSMRNMDQFEITNLFSKALLEDRIYAMKWLFFLRDVRGGLGERRSFRMILMELAIYHSVMTSKLIKIIPEYGRWDDLLFIASLRFKDDFDDNLLNSVVNLVISQLKADHENMLNNKPCSLLAKWMPNAYSKNYIQRKEGQFWANKLFPYISNDNARECNYRKLISSLRKYLDVVECKMSSNRWDEVNYETVPSKANLRYSNAFMIHDEERRTKFLDMANKGEVKINSSVAFPHDIVHKYGQAKDIDSSLEAMWKNLPDTINNQTGDVLVVRDGSGSMTWEQLNDSRITPLTIATALTIYFAERIKGQFKDKFVTFSSRPKLIDLSNLDTLQQKLRKTYLEDDCSNTNIEAVFRLILNTAKNNKMNQEDIPSTVLILSDMEFDPYSHNCDERLFDSIGREYSEAGYKLPKLVFWNICSRTKTIPVTENEMGVALISGFSANLAKMVMSNQTDPYKILIETLDSPRYNIIEELLS